MTMSKSLKKLYPFKSHYLSVSEDVNIHYVDEGQGDPIVLVHGNPTWSFYFRNIILNLRHTHRVIAIDHIGCGLSSKPQNYEYTLENHIQNLETLIKFLNLDNITMGVHDWGGAIGFGAALRIEDRMNKFVLFNTAAFYLDALPFRISLCRRPKGIAEVFVRAFNGFLGPSLYMGRAKKITKSEKEGYLYPYQNYQDRVAIFNFVQDIPMEDDHPTRELLDSIELGISQRFQNRDILVLWGAQDFCFNDKFLNRFKEIFPNANYKYFKDASHFIIDDKRDEVIKEIASFVVR